MSQISPALATVQAASDHPISGALCAASPLPTGIRLADLGQKPGQDTWSRRDGRFGSSKYRLVGAGSAPNFPGENAINVGPTHAKTRRQNGRRIKRGSYFIRLLPRQPGAAQIKMMTHATGVPLSPLVFLVQIVVLNRSKKQVIRAYAPWVVAAVQNPHTSRYLAICQSPGNAMGGLDFPTFGLKATVFRFGRCGPFPAAIALGDLRPEPSSQAIILRHRYCIAGQPSAKSSIQ